MISQPTPDPIDISNSELKTWDRCTAKWYFKYVLNLRARRVSRPLVLGRLIHDTLEEYYNPLNQGDRNPDLLMEAIRECYADYRHEGAEDPNHEVWRLVVSILKAYGVQYANNDWIPLDTEMNFKVGIFSENRLVGFVHGRWDAVVMDKEQRVWVVDHKTTKRFSFGYLEMDPQMDLYCLAGAKIFGERFRGMMLNFIRTKPSKSRANFQRVPVRRTPEELRFIEANIALKLGLLGRLDPSMLSYTFTKTCSWDCNYIGLCRSVRTGGDLMDQIRTNFSVRKSLSEEEEEVQNDKT